MGGAKRKAMQRIEESSSDIADRFPFRHSLDTGDRGPLVLWAQSKLTEREHYQGPLDGRYDLEVSKAVRAFQAANGLRVTGVVDRKTWNAL